METARSSQWRTVLAVSLFGGLAALEVHDGLQRFERIRDRRRGELLALVDGQQEPLAREVAERIGDGLRHAAHLARHPFVRELLQASAAEDHNQRLGRILLPYLASFPEIDRLQVLDRDMHQRFRCERMGGGVATLPTGLLEDAPLDELAALVAQSRGTEVAVSPLSYDAERVEVEPADRRVFHLVAPVREAHAVLGTVVVTVYAAPLLRALASFQPLPGTSSCLLDARGSPLAPVNERAEAGGACARIIAASADLARRIVAGERRIDTDGAVLFARATGVDMASFVVSAVPSVALTPGVPVGEGRRAALRTLIVLSAIGLGSAFFVRTSQRAARLAETERYARRIREESDRRRALMDAAADMILVVDPRANDVEDWNPRAGELLARDVVGGRMSLDSVAAAFEADGGLRLRAGLDAASSGARNPAAVTGLALVRDNQRMDLDARCIGIDYGGRRLVELSLSDRTRERDMERRARTAERLSALGLLTAGVAHEINNPLEGIGNYLTLLERAEDPERRAGFADRVRQGLERIREITSELLPIARTVRRDDAADLGRVVERAVSMARFSQDLRNVDVRTEGFEAPCTVTGSEGGLEQIVLNLLLNAGRAMGGSGVIRVRAVGVDGGRIEVCVEDDGPGIAEEDLDRVFDPFFSKGGGTGLGLSVSYQIARAHGGDLSASNRSGGGARFRLRLPLASGDRDEEHGGNT